MATDTHLIIPPPPASGTVPTPHSFSGILDGGLSADVQIQGRAAAMAGSTATNTPVHMPIGGTFASPPKNQGRIVRGSATAACRKRTAAARPLERIEAKRPRRARAQAAK